MDPHIRGRRNFGRRLFGAFALSRVLLAIGTMYSRIHAMALKALMG
jgi:hypothetical protein